jgi:serine/threonine protein kinase
MNERDILTAVSHPFIVNMHTTFKDDQNLYFLMDAALGGDVYNLMRTQRRRMALPEVQFYLAQIVLVLEYLHQKQIVYRDIKVKRRSLLLAAPPSARTSPLSPSARACPAAREHGD